jgi:hypothetical protein
MDGSAHVGRHAHRQRVERNALGAQLIIEFTQHAEGRALLVEIVFRLGDGHQAAQDEARQRGHGMGQRCGVGGQHATFAGLPAGIDLDAGLHGVQALRPLFAQALRNLLAFNRVHPIEVFGYKTRLIALDWSDEVPLQRRAATHFCQLVDLVHALLHIVFTKSTLSRQHCLENCLRREGLGHGQQLHFVGCAPRFACGNVNCFSNNLQVVGYCGHNRMRQAKLFWLLKKHRDYKWTFPNYSHSPSRTRHPTCTCLQACRR